MSRRLFNPKISAAIKIRHRTAVFVSDCNPHLPFRSNSNLANGTLYIDKAVFIRIDVSRYGVTFTPNGRLVAANCVIWRNGVAVVL
jgi:hypothetical protein